MKKSRFLFVILFIFLFFVSLSAYTSLDIKLRFFKGFREGIDEQFYSMPQSYLQPIITAIIKAKFELVEEEMEIGKIFNLKDVHLIAEAEDKWRFHGSDKISHNFRIDGKEYLILITPIDRAREHLFRIEVLEKSTQNKEILLDTRIILPRNSTVVIMLEDVHGKPYFISFHITGGTIGGIVGGVTGCVKKDLN